MNPEVEKHYKDWGKDLPRYGHASWPREKVLQRAAHIHDFLQMNGLMKKKFRIVLDYDPEFPRASFTVYAETSENEQPAGIAGAGTRGGYHGYQS